jgi:tol-pal system protein YbgF
MDNAMRKCLAFLLVCLALAGCTQNDQLAAVQSRLDAHEQRLNTLEELRSRQANLSADLEDLRVKVSALQGQVDELVMRISPPPEEPPDPLTAPDEPDMSRPGMEEPAASPESIIANATAEVQAQAEAQEGAAPGSGEPQPADLNQTEDPARELYNRALTQFKARNYQAAQALWKEFVKSYPEHELVPNSIFWQGESFYQLGDYPQAILAYQDVISKYPKSGKYPSALLKQGISFIKIGKTQAGRLLLSDVIKNYPNTPEAERAKEYLKNPM